MSLNQLKNSRNYSEYKFGNLPLFMEVTAITPLSKDKGKYCCMIYDLSYFFSHALSKAKEQYILTEREFEILQAVLKGKSNEEIAAELFLSLPTVKKYLTSIYNKMDVKNQKQIITKLSIQ